MRRVPGGGPDEAKRILRERAQEQAALLVSRPGYPIYGLSAPALGPVQVSEYSSSNGQWTSVTLSYGPFGDQSGPRVTVTTALRGNGVVVSRSGSQRPPDAESRQDAGNVTVAVATWGIAMDTVRTAPVPDLRPVIEAALEAAIAYIDRRLREHRPPPLDLPPVEGVAALRALADFTMAATREIRASARGGHGLRHGPDWGRVHNALWQRAVRERQRLGGIGHEAADADVTSAVNHLGQLVEHAPWFEADPRLREAAVDETLRYTLFGETVPSLRAQQAWTAYWSAHRSGLGHAASHEESLAGFEALESLLADWLAAWTDWTSAMNQPPTGSSG